MPGSGPLGFGMTVALKDAFTSVANKSAGAARGLGTALKQVKGVAGQLWGAVPGLAKFAGAAGAVYAGVVQPLQIVTEWEKNLHSLRALLLSLGKTPAEVAQMMSSEIEPAIQEFTKTYGTDSKQVIDAFWAAFSGGAETTADAMGLVTGAAKAFRGYGLEMPKAIQLVSDVWDQYGREAGTAEEIMGRLAVAQGVGNLTLQELGTNLREVLPLARKVGFSWDETTATLVALTRGSGDAGSATTKLKNVLTNLASLQGRPEILDRLRFAGVALDETTMKGKGLMGTLRLMRKAMIDAAPANAGARLTTLGLSFSAASLKGKGLALAAATIAKKMEEMGRAGKTKEIGGALKQLRIDGSVEDFMLLPIEKRALAMANALRQTELVLFNDAEAMSAFSSLTGEGSKQGAVFDDALKKMSNSGRVLEDALADAAETPEMKLARMRAEFEEVQLTIGKELMPILLDVVQALSDIDWKATIAEIRAAIVDISQAVSKAWSNAGNQYEWWYKQWDRDKMFWSNPVNNLIQALGGLLGFDWHAIVKSGDKALQDFGNWCIRWAWDIGQRLSNDWEWLSSTFASKWGPVWASAKRGANDFAGGFALAMTDLARAAGSAWDTVKLHSGWMWEALKNEASFQADGFVQFWGDLGRDIGTAFGDAFQATVDFGSWVGEGIAQGFSDVWDWASNLPQQTYDWMDQAFGSIVDALGLRNVGESFTSIWKGIQGVTNSMIEAMRAAINGIVDTLNSALFDYTFAWSDSSLGSLLGMDRIPHLAEGGVVTRPTVALMGEAGPEAVVPLSRQNLIPGLGGRSHEQAILAELKRLNGAITALANRPVSVVMDGKEVAKLVTRQQQWQGSAA